MSEFPTKEIHGFDTPIKYREFAQQLEECLRAGTAKEVPVDQFYGDGRLVGGRWFIDMSTSRTWRLVGPVEPSSGVWEQVYVA